MGLHFVPDNLKFDFVGIRKIAYVVSALLLLAGIASLVVNGGPRYGIDFAGGTVVQVHFEQAIPDEDVKKALDGSNLPGLVVQSFGEAGTDYLLRVSSQDEDSAADVRAIVTSALDGKLAGKPYSIERLEMVGPKVGADLRAKALEALFYATLLIAVYVSGRFEQRWTLALIMAVVLGGGTYLLGSLMSSFMQGNYMGLLILLAAVLTILFCWRLKLAFAIGALVSIVHDLLITVGLFSLMGKEFDLTIIAALLTVVGYSLNDTIIVFDRIRENLRANKKNENLAAVINKSINRTMSRTLLTSLTTLFVVLSLLFLGGDIIHDFALVMCIGVLIGTYSSIFVASPVLMAFESTIFMRVKEEQEAKAKEEVLKRNKSGAVV